MEEKSEGLQLFSMKNIHFLIAFAIMMVFRFIPPVDPITSIGMQVLGIFIGTLYLWTTVDVLWSSVFCVAMVGLSDYDTMGAVLTAAFGNTVAVQSLFMFIIIGALVHEGITDHIGRFFLTRKFSEGKPWVLTFMVCLGTFVMAAFVKALAAIILFWPVAYAIFEQVNYTNKDKYPKLMVTLIVLSALAGFPVAPYMQNGLALLANYRTISGDPTFVNDGMYFITQLILGLLFVVIAVLICKFVFRPDVDRLKNVTIADLNKNPLPALDTRQKALGWGFVILTAAMLFPSWFKTMPVFSFLYSNSIGLATLIVGILAGLHISGKPILDAVPAIKKGVPWGTWFLIVAAIFIGSALTNEKTGISAFLKAVLSPMFNDMNVITFVLVAMIIQGVLTNVSNSLVIGLIFQPIIMVYCQAAGVNPAPIVTLSIFFVLSSAMFTPAASPFAAMLFANREWVSPTDIYKFTGVFIIAELVLVMVVGWPLCTLLMH